jgi:hypothetical protein
MLLGCPKKLQGEVAVSGSSAFIAIPVRLVAELDRFKGEDIEDASEAVDADQVTDLSVGRMPDVLLPMSFQSFVHGVSPRLMKRDRFGSVPP